jgi:hypothetical protein
VCVCVCEKRIVFVDVKLDDRSIQGGERSTSYLFRFFHAVFFSNMEHNICQTIGDVRPNILRHDLNRDFSLVLSYYHHMGCQTFWTKPRPFVGIDSQIIDRSFPSAPRALLLLGETLSSERKRKITPIVP